MPDLLLFSKADCWGGLNVRDDSGAVRKSADQYQKTESELKGNSTNFTPKEATCDLVDCLQWCHSEA